MRKYPEEEEEESDGLDGIRATLGVDGKWYFGGWSEVRTRPRPARG